MTNELKSTFSDLEATAFRTYAADLLDAYPSAPERQRLQAYMLQTIAADRKAIETAQTELSTKRFRRTQHQTLLEELVLAHAHDYQRSASLFVEQSKTDAEIIALLTQDDAEVFISGRNLSGTIALSGDRVKLCGLDYTGTAAANTLAPTCIVTGRIIISGSDVTVEGVHFKFASQWGQTEEPLISFVGGTNQKLTLKNCIFEHTGGGAGAFADGRFFCGSGSGGGVQVIEGCVIKNFTSWLLLDATTNSGAATVKIDSFKLDACRIDNCMGSMAVRGIQTNPNGEAVFTNNIWAFGAQGQHAQFWDCFETNNTLRVTCTGNTCTGATKTDNRGFLQAWSRSSVPWYVRYRDNTIENFAACFRCACNATFYAPNQQHQQFSLKSTPAQTTNVDYGGSYVYPYNDATKTYAPENGGTFSEPAGDFAGLSNFAHA